MKKINRFLSIILVLTLLAGILPTRALADETVLTEQSQDSVETTTPQPDEETTEPVTEETVGKIQPPETEPEGDNCQVEPYGLLVAQDLPDEVNITLELGGTYMLTDESGDYSRDDLSGINKDVATVAASGLSVKGPRKISAESHSWIPEGIYYIESARKTQLINNGGATDTNVLLGLGGTGNYPEMSGKIADITDTDSSNDPTVWTVEQTEGGYFLKTQNRYLAIPGNDQSTISSEEHTVELVKYTDVKAQCAEAYTGSWTIKDDTMYLNHYGSGNNVKAAGYDVAADDGNTWNFYDASAYTDLVFTAQGIGTTSIILGDTTYNITVRAVADALDLFTLIQTAGMYNQALYTQASWDTLTAALSTANEAVKKSGHYTNKDDYFAAQQEIDNARSALEAALAGLSAKEAVSLSVLKGETVSYTDLTGGYTTLSATDYASATAQIQYTYQINAIDPNEVKEGQAYYIINCNSGNTYLGWGLTEKLEWPTAQYVMYADPWTLVQNPAGGGYVLMQEDEHGVPHYVTWNTDLSAVVTEDITQATVTYYDTAENRFEDQSGNPFGIPAARGALGQSVVTVTGLKETEGEPTVLRSASGRDFNVTVYLERKELHLNVGAVAEFDVHDSVEGAVATGSDEVSANVEKEPNSGTLTLRITADAVGIAEFKVDGTLYCVHVEDLAEENTEEILLYVGQRKAVPGEESGHYVTWSETAIGIVSTRLSGGIGTPVLATAISDHHQYYIASCRTGNLLTSDPYGNGLHLAGTFDQPPERSCWNVKLDSDSNYYVYRCPGQNLQLGYRTANLSGTTSLRIESCSTKDAWVLGAGGYYLHQLGGVGYVEAGGYRNYNDTGSHWYLYEPDNGYTDVSFTALTPGYTEVTVGTTTYKITVRASDYGTSTTDDTAVVGGNGEGINKPVTGVTTSVGMYYDLNIDPARLGVDENTPVTWEIEDDTVASIDENGKIVGKAVGNTKVRARVTLPDGSERVYYVRVTVWPGNGTDSGKITNIYISDINNTSVYYSLDCSDQICQFWEGEAFYICNSTNANHSLDFFGDPDENYVLDGMSATGSYSHYYSIQVDQAKNSEFFLGHVAGGIQLSWFEDKKVYQMVETAMDLGCHGVMGFTRPSTDSGGINSILTFNSDPLPTVDKSINGVLPAAGKYEDYRRYQPGMQATVGEYIYYDVVVTLKRPLVMQQDGVSGAVVYNEAVVRDLLNGAYFYTKDLDQKDPDGKNDGIIATPENRKNVQNITDWLNQPWAGDEQERTLTLYVVYPIAKDYVEDSLTNNVELTVGYRSAYSSGTGTGSAEAMADMTIVHRPLPNIVVDFGMSVTFTVTETTENTYNLENTQNGAHTANYGTVSVSESISDGETHYTITYTPTTVLQNFDVAVLRNADGEVVNGFLIYPATTVYYEETFAHYGHMGDQPGQPASNSWEAGAGNPLNTTQQTHLVANQATRADLYSFGYDGVYADDPAGPSNDTEKISNGFGDKATFTFTGTGVEIYANCNENTGRVAVMIYEELEGDSDPLERFYIVDTHTGAGDTPATDFQQWVHYSLPIVSVRDLTHGTYRVELQHIRKAADTGDEISPLRLDGFRVHDTLNNLAHTAYPESEKDPLYVEVRNHVLGGLGVKEEENAFSFIGQEDFIDQVYNKVGTTKGIVKLLKNGNEVVDPEKFRQDLLNNGPKNEIFLEPGASIVFELVSGVTAQIGLKAINGQVKYNLTNEVQDDSDNTVTGTTNAHVISSSTDMFYHTLSGVVVIENPATEGASAVLSVTLVKAFGAASDGGILKSAARSARTVAAAESDSIFVPITTQTLSFAMRALNGEFVPPIQEPDETEPSETTEPTEETEPSESTEPTEEPEPSESTEPTEEPEPSETTEPTEEPEPSETTEPTEEPEPSETTEPTEEPEPSETTEPTEEPEPSETTKPTEEPEPSETTEPTEPEDSEPLDNPFTDVAEGEYYYAPVLWAVTQGVTTGTAADTFSPAKECTRAQVVTFLWRAAGEPEPGIQDNPFKDVYPGEYYYDAVLWAVEQGITTGMDAETFGTDLPCNRGQVVTFLWRTAGKPMPGSEQNPFADVEQESYYYSAVLWAVEQGITTGMTPNEFQPNTTCNRAQIVTFLYRYLAN